MTKINKLKSKIKSNIVKIQGKRHFIKKKQVSVFRWQIIRYPNFQTITFKIFCFSNSENFIQAKPAQAS